MYVCLCVCACMCVHIYIEQTTNLYSENYTYDCTLTLCYMLNWGNDNVLY